MPRSGESPDMIVLEEAYRIILYEPFEDSDEESSGPTEVESSHCMMSEPDFGEDELSPAIHFTSETPITEGHRCTGNISRYSDDVFIEMQGEYSGIAVGCCVANFACEGDHDMNCGNVDYSNHPKNWNVGHGNGITPLRLGLQSLRWNGETSDDEISSSESAEVVMLSSKRPIITYLIYPVIKTINTAMREP